ncbi:hypothetical protein AcW1_004695 [Taiwanofungus camphoratus]|nr:hypothetical protein AcW2_006302 [Antrodia cinnamomea]KAI0938282.1 hypothetical protein AcV7_003508 [Antrodia cinnamomea]KAI0939778.1 hypothetical protein AcV5_001077 [Antrodia cinnamomea]KAI0960070.1 hypothetical protein AcW1_004695 [Antrodia cinnamomea]
MLVMFLLSFFGAVVLCCLFFQSVWGSITAGDDVLDAHEAGIALVASRTPFRETGPPACMAKLIMLRHKIHQDTRRRYSSSRARQASRTYNPTSFRPSRDIRCDAPWIRLGRARGKQNY